MAAKDVIAILFVVAYVVLFVWMKHEPEALKNALLVIVGFYFGNGAYSLWYRLTKNGG